MQQIFVTGVARTMSLTSSSLSLDKKRIASRYELDSLNLEGP